MDDPRRQAKILRLDLSRSTWNEVEVWVED
jgi:hypothetical protein